MNFTKHLAVLNRFNSLNNGNSSISSCFLFLKNSILSPVQQTINVQPSLYNVSMRFAHKKTGGSTQNKPNRQPKFRRFRMKEYVVYK